MYGCERTLLVVFCGLSSFSQSIARHSSLLIRIMYARDTHRNTTWLMTFVHANMCVKFFLRSYFCAGQCERWWWWFRHRSKVKLGTNCWHESTIVWRWNAWFRIPTITNHANSIIYSLSYVVWLLSCVELGMVAGNFVGSGLLWSLSCGGISLMFVYGIRCDATLQLQLHSTNKTERAFSGLDAVVAMQSVVACTLSQRWIVVVVNFAYVFVDDLVELDSWSLDSWVAISVAISEFKQMLDLTEKTCWKMLDFRRRILKKKLDCTLHNTHKFNTCYISYTWQ